MRRTRPNEGYVTLAVLVMAGLLAAVVSTLLAVSRPAIGLARIGADEIAAQSLAEAGITAAAYLLFQAEREAAAVTGTMLRLRSGKAQLTVAGESGRIDLNHADPALLAGLYSAAGGTSLRPVDFAARVTDWRDQNRDREEGGAEADDYADAGSGYAPSDGPFRSVHDLRLILGLSEADFGRLLPYVTIFSGSQRVDAESAPFGVLRAIPGLGEAGARQIIQARQRGAGGEEALAALIASHGDYLAEDLPRVYRVTATARLDSGPSEKIEAVIKAAAEGGAGFQVMAWSRNPP